MKKFIIALIVLVAIPFIAAVVLALVVDPNDYKPQISEAVEEQTGRELDMKGEIEWQFFPSFGISMSDVTLANPEGFEEPYMASLKSLSVSIAVIPLFSGQLEVEGVEVDQARLNIITLADGTNNLDDLTEGQDEQEPQEPEVTIEIETDDDSSLGLEGISIGKIEIRDIQVLVDNQQTQSQQKFALALFELSQFIPGKRSDARLELNLDTADLKAEVTFTSSLTLTEAMDAIALHQFELETRLQGDSLPKGNLNKRIAGLGNIQLNPLAVELEEIQIEVASLVGTGWLKFRQTEVPDISFALNFETFNLADFVPPGEASESEPEAEVVSTEPEVEPDLTGLQGVKLDGLVTVNKVLAQGAELSDVSLTLQADEGIIKVAPLKARLYEGEFVTQATLNATQPVAAYQADVSVQGVQVMPLLQDVAELKVLAGAAHFDMTLNGKGLTSTKLKTASEGKGQFRLTDGAVYGVNIPQKIRSIKASLAGEATAQEEKKTDFTELTGSFTLAQGIVNNPDLMLASPLLRVEGKGDFDLVKTYVDYHAAAELVATSKGQGGKSADDLTGLRIPLRIKGTPDDLSYKLDADSALKEETKRKAKEKEKELKEKAKEKLKDKIGNLFG